MWAWARWVAMLAALTDVPPSSMVTTVGCTGQVDAGVEVAAQLPTTCGEPSTVTTISRCIHAASPAP
jgi:hypothetical protein